jgi:AraC family transcriptional regulator, regulatory protein of adaptative response / methylated-DNA-[protein]-cysteine methyltransferase
MNEPNDSFVDSRDFARIAKSIRFIATHFREQPRLAAIADHAGLSEFHFNRLFRRWAGVTPKQYLAYITGREAHGQIINQSSVLDTAYSVGLSGPGRLHDLIVTLDAVTPGELKALGRGIPIHYGFTETPFGEALLATTPRGLCHLSFVDTGERVKAFNELREQWRNADLMHDDARARVIANQIWGATGAQRRESREAPAARRGATGARRIRAPYR